MKPNTNEGLRQQIAEATNNEQIDNLLQRGRANFAHASFKRGERIITKTMRKMIPVEFDKRDGMPVEVATKLLLEPRARMSSAMRRECQRARERTITSPTPIRRCAMGGYETDADQQRKPYPVKCAAAVAKRSMAKLFQIWTSAARRRLAVQEPFLKAEEQLAQMQAETEQAAVVRNAGRYGLITESLRRLADEANRLDTLLDAIVDELEKRCLNVNSPEWQKKWLHN